MKLKEIKAVQVDYTKVLKEYGKLIENLKSVMKTKKITIVFIAQNLGIKEHKLKYFLITKKIDFNLLKVVWDFVDKI